MSYFDFKGWQPDANPATQGILTEVYNIVPTLRGFKAGESLNNAGYDALTDVTQGGVIVYKLDDVSRLIVGTETKLYEGSGGLWTDQSRSGGYTSSADGKWRFIQFGNVTIATNRGDEMQFSNDSGPFDDIPSAFAPKASIIETVKGFVLAFNIQDVTEGIIPDGWVCSGLFDYTHWPERPLTGPDSAAQCAYGRLVSSPGPIKAARRLGDNIIVYKERSMYIGTYVGPPFVWSFEMLPGEIGAPSQEAVVTTGSLHFFVGPDDFYVFDGTRPQPIGTPVKNWFFSRLNQTSRYKIQTYHNRLEANIYFYFPSLANDEGSIDDCIVYNYKSNTWGEAAKNIETVLDVVTGGLTYDDLGDLYATWDDIPSISFDSPFWVPSVNAQAVFDMNHTLYTITGESGQSSVTTHEMGDDDQFTTFKRAKPRFLIKPTSGSAMLYSRYTTDDDFLSYDSATLTEGKFDMMNSARWHKVTMEFNGKMEIAGTSVNATVDGTE